MHFIFGVDTPLVLLAVGVLVLPPERSPSRLHSESARSDCTGLLCHR
ncbi:hypothetical protein [Haladaptatus sp. DYF46]|nr:hypothetical protein [Haladaptatus sp. DYF46]